jgi:hypothetical protein
MVEEVLIELTLMALYFYVQYGRRFATRSRLITKEQMPMKKSHQIVKCVAFVTIFTSLLVCTVSIGYGGGYYCGYHGGWYYGGWWYPYGAVIAFLPFYYQTFWIGGYPYYYADGVYYAPTAGGYMVVNPPKGELYQPPTKEQPSMDLFIYPRKGQSEKQQADDRYQCHRWAVGQTGYDPTQPAGGVPSLQKHADYNRAMTACLDARSYTATAR